MTGSPSSPCRPRRFALALLALWLAGCSAQRTLVPLLSGPAGAARCAETCAQRQRSRPDALHSCLQSCPGVRVVAGACAPDEAPPRAVCVTRRPFRLGLFLLYLLGAVALSAAFGGAAWAAR